MQKDFLQSFQGFQNLELVDISFTDEQLNELAEALELALKKVPVSDFEGRYWNDENGAMRMGIKSGVPFMEDVEEEINEDFDGNYTIMGNEAARHYYSEFEEIMKECITAKDMDEYNEESKRLIKIGRPKEERMIYHKRFDGKLINRCYDELIHSVNKFSSRFAFHALGVIILNCGAKMTDNIKIQILENSHWNDERHKFKNRAARIERKKYLFDFIIKIIEYKEGELIKIPWVPRENFKKKL